MSPGRVWILLSQQIILTKKNILVQTTMFVHTAAKTDTVTLWKKKASKCLLLSMYQPA